MGTNKTNQVVSNHFKPLVYQNFSLKQFETTGRLATEIDEKAVFFVEK